MSRSITTSRSRARLSVLAILIAFFATIVAITPTSASAGYPGRDGRIAFVRQNQIYTIGADGKNLKQLTTGNKNYRPHFSPDGKRIVYINERAGQRELWIMKADGTGKVQVTHLGQVTGATWSPDGTTLAFGGWSNVVGPGQEPSAGLRLMTISAIAPFGQPSIVWVEPGEYQHPQKLEADGTPSWSPDGTKIVYYTWEYPSSPDHYIIELTVATGAVWPIAWIGGACCGFGSYADPTYSPSNVVGYTHNEEGGPTLLRAWANNSTPVITNTLNGDQQLSWSPSGGRIALVNNSSGTSKIFLAKKDGTNRKALTTGYQPDWQPLP